MFLEEDRPSVLRRFEEKYIPEPNSGCWLWTASLTNKGYGELMLRHTRRTIGAHRISYKLFKGVIPDDMNVLHMCDIPSCVNPDHLELGTQAQNMQDSVSRGRSRKGRVFPDEWKLSQDEVEALRKDSRASRKVAQTYGISHMQVQHIRRD